LSGVRLASFGTKAQGSNLRWPIGPADRPNWAQPRPTSVCLKTNEGGTLTWRSGWSLDEAGGKGVAVERGGEPPVALFAPRPRRTHGTGRPKWALLAGWPSVALGSWFALCLIERLMGSTHQSAAVPSSGCCPSGNETVATNGLLPMDCLGPQRIAV